MMWCSTVKKSLPGWRSWSVFAELPDQCRLSIRVDGGGDLIQPIEAVYRFELYIADRRGFQLLVVFVSVEDEHVWLLPTDWLSIFVAENCALQFSVAVASRHFA